MNKKLLTKEASEEHINNGGKIELVPHIYLDQKMCLKYIELGGEITNVPKRFITPNMCKTYIKKGGKLAFVPPKFINHKLCKEYIEQGGALVKVPEDYVDQLLCISYIEKGGNIKAVPRKYRTKKLCEGYKIQNIDDLEYIPKKYITKEMVKEAWKHGTDIKYIPEQFITKEMAEDYIEESGDLKYVPEKVLSEKMVSKYIEKGGNITSVPTEYATIEVIDNTKDVNKVSRYSSKEQQQIVLRILLTVPKTGLIKEEIKEKYHVSSTIIDKVLEKIKKEDEKKYIEIMNVFDNSDKSQEYTKYYNDYAAKIVDIVKSVGQIRNGRLTKEQRIQFSYLLGTADVKSDIYNIYDFLYDQSNKPEKSRQFVVFCKSYLGFKYRNKKTGFSDMDITEEQEFLMESGAKWFTPVDKEKYFKDRNGSPLKHYFIDNSNNTVEIKEEDLDIILKYLKTQKIAASDCIVKEACARYVNGELEIFCDELTSGNYLEMQKEKQKTKTLK